MVDRTGADGDDVPFVILHGGDAASAVKIECFFDDADEWAEGRIGRLNAGEAVTVRGEYDGRVSHVQVRECELSKSPPPPKGGSGTKP